MNRMEEYENLLQELEQPVSKLEHTVERANKKMKRRNRIIRSVMSTAAVFALFVLLVNVSAPVAQACSRIPVLKELAEAVTFSPSLTKAVESEYMQPLGLIQQDGDVEANIAYLIVDQKQVNVFFTLDSEVYTLMNADPKILDADGGSPSSCSYSINAWDIPNGELNSITIDFVNENVPDTLRLQLNVRDFSEPASEEGVPLENANDVLFEEKEIEESEYIAHFDFLLEFDPEFTATGKYYEINETVILEGQRIVIKDVEVFPSHMRVNIEDIPENTAWLKSLEFYIETEEGMRFEPVANGITATGSGDSPTMASFRADSSYFYEAKQLKLVITGAEWLRKDMEKVYINLKTGKTAELPEGVEFYSAEEHTSGWVLKLQSVQRKPDYYHQILGHTYYDADGNEYEIRAWTNTMGEDKPDSGYIIETVSLKGFYEDEVWVSPLYSHLWVAEEPVEILVE